MCFLLECRNTHAYTLSESLSQTDTDTCTHHINAHGKQCRHHDPDERFMATSDITAKLEHYEGQLDKGLQVSIRNAIISQLEDSSSDVQTVAVKW